MGRTTIVALATLAFAASGCTWIVRASVDGSGVQGNSGSSEPVLNGDGRFVAFSSSASNLVEDDTNNVRDVFVRDNRTGVVERVSVADSNAAQADDASSSPRVSEDGRYVAFGSLASNLVPGDTEGTLDLFVRDRTTGTTELIASQALPPAILSGDGRYVVYREPDQVNVYDRELQETETFPIASTASALSISDDGRYVTFGVFGPGPPPFAASIVRDRQTSTSETLFGTLPGAISGDGRFFVYDELVTVASDKFRTRVVALDRATATTELISVTSEEVELTDVDADFGAVSDDGRYVLFSSFGAYVPDDTNGSYDAYVRDRATGNTFLAVRSAAGGIASLGSSPGVDISDDGRYIAFAAPPGSSNLVSGDTNGAEDVFVRAFPQPAPRSASPSMLGRGTTTTVTLEGDYLLSSSQVAITGGGVSVDSVILVSDQELTVSITVEPGAVPGPRGVIVSIAGTGAGATTGSTGGCACLTIV